MCSLFPHFSICHCKKTQGPWAELAGGRNSCLNMGWGGGAEPVFVDLLRSPGIDSQIGRPVRLPYFSYRLARLHRLAKSIPWNWFLGFINVYKYGLSCPILQSNANTQQHSTPNTDNNFQLYIPTASIDSLQQLCWPSLAKYWQLNVRKKEQQSAINRQIIFIDTKTFCTVHSVHRIKRKRSFLNYFSYLEGML